MRYCSKALTMINSTAKHAWTQRTHFVDENRYLEFREIEFAKLVTKRKIVSELENAVDLKDQIEVAELIADFTLPLAKRKNVLSNQNLRESTDL
eukprot:UN22887